MITYAPEHKLFWLPLKLYQSDEFQRELQAFQKDTGSTGSINAGFIQLFAKELTQDVFVIETHKNLDVSPGGFTIHVVDRRENRPSYADMIQANDLILIQFHGGAPNGTFENVMLGVVSRISRSTAVSEHRVSHSVEIIGQDIMRWLYQGRNFFWFYAGVGSKKDGVSELAERQKAYEMYFPNRGQSDLPSAQILENILNGYIGVFFPRVRELVRFNAIATRSSEAAFLADEPILGLGEHYIPNMTLDAYEGSFVNLMIDHQMDYLAELWSDTTKGGGFSINYRRVPFDETDWAAFTVNDAEETRQRHIVPDADIISISTGKSDEVYYNFISSVPWVYAANTSLIRFVLDGTKRLDLSSIKDRGVRPLFITNKYMDKQVTSKTGIAQFQGSFDDALKNMTFSMEPPKLSVPLTQVDSSFLDLVNKNGELYKIADEWSKTLWRWYSQLDRYYSGTIRIRGRPEIKVGHQLELPCESKSGFMHRMLFYVQGVTHLYDTTQGNFITSLQVNRGQPFDAFVRPVTDGLEDAAEAEADKQKHVLINDHPLSAQPFKQLTLDIEVNYGTTAPPKPPDILSVPLPDMLGGP